MTKRLASKYKICRRNSENLWGRPKKFLTNRLYPPGVHGRSRRRRPTDYGVQLAAKQKLKGYYGNITERQFRRIYEEAYKRRGDTIENMIGLLERRLDIVIYRMKFVPTVFAARPVRQPRTHPRQWPQGQHSELLDRSRGCDRGQGGVAGTASRA